jgi:hypothetical protein
MLLDDVVDKTTAARTIRHDISTVENGDDDDVVVVVGAVFLRLRTVD